MDCESSATAASASSLVPGFRFHPTDEELVRYYLRRKICGKPFRIDAISVVDVYKLEPWDLPGKSRLKSRDLEWYFFSVLDKKYGNGSKTNRATDRGYWKTTGKDRPVYYRTRVVGMKKTLVYHSGRAPRGERSNWVMHEYRLVDEELGKAGIVQDSFVLCRIFQKSGPGPKNGEKYGAPLIEEEWEDDEFAMVPKDEFAVELPISDDTCQDDCFDETDLEQIMSAVDLPFIAPPPNSGSGDENQYVGESTNLIIDPQELLVGMDESILVREQPSDASLCNFPVPNNVDENSVKHEYIGGLSYSGESRKEDHVDVDSLLDELFLDANGFDSSPIGDGAFIETNDFKQPVEENLSSFDKVQFFDAADNLPYLDFDYSNMMFDSSDVSLQQLGFDYSNMMESDVPSESTLLLPFKDVNESSKQQANREVNQQLEGHIDGVASYSKKTHAVHGSDYQYPSIKKVNQMLGNIPAPPAFASEFPTKGTAVRLNSASSSAFHVTASVIQIRNVRGTDGSYGKHGFANIVLSFGPSRSDDYSVGMQPPSDKAYSAIYWSWFYFLFMWVVFFSFCFKFGSYICAN